ncbi:MAG: hypothetical protein ACTTKN_02690 [Phocaeicola sp.]|uniref:hypothetical protein n=1 Tax=Phocaeicola TaxID=909656 RepID=UPI00234F45AF|nr:hypothetical protein [Phocaeicola oris]MCE2615826.1 hypothetical protein [Phocaeicola oris]
MKIRTLFFSFIMMTLAAGCGSKDDPTPNPPTPTPTPTPKAETFKGVLFAASVTNAEGNSGTVHLQAVPDFTPGNYDNKNSIPMGFGVMPIATNRGNIYTLPDYMGGGKSEIVRYTLNDKAEWQKQGALAVPAKSSPANIVELNDEKAFLTLQGTGKIMVFNPKTMTKIEDIDLNALSYENTNVSPAAMVIRDEKLYVGLNQMGARYMPVKNTVEVAIIDAKTNKLLKHIVDEKPGFCFATRPIDPRSIFVDEHNDIYINCIGAFGFLPDFPGGIVRIKSGQDEIDPTYKMDISKIKVEGLSCEYGEFLSTVCYDKNGLLYGYLNAYKLDPTGMEHAYTCLTNVAVCIDLKAKTIKAIKGLDVSNPHGVAVGKHKNLIVFGNAGKKTTGFFSYEPTTGKVEGPVMNITGNPFFFYSYAE